MNNIQQNYERDLMAGTGDVPNKQPYSYLVGFFTNYKGQSHNMLLTGALLVGVVLINSASFASGMLYSRSTAKIPIQICTTATSTPSTVITENIPDTAGKRVDQTVYASKNGTRYYFPWCAGAARLSEKTKITFKTAHEAQKAGYEPAANCKGLE